MHVVRVLAVRIIFSVYARDCTMACVLCTISVQSCGDCVMHACFCLHITVEVGALGEVYTDKTEASADILRHQCRDNCRSVMQFWSDMTVCRIVI